MVVAMGTETAPRSGCPQRPVTHLRGGHVMSLHRQPRTLSAEDIQIYAIIQDKDKRKDEEQYYRSRVTI